MTSKRTQGFTLIELTLVMAFLSVLLIAIIMTTLQMGKLYTKGLTNRSMNQVGRDLGDTLRRDFLAASSTRILIPAATGTGTALSGRLCLGTVSYVWNTADLLNQATATKITKGGVPVVLERVIDTTNRLCTVQGSGTYVTDIDSSYSSRSVLTTDGRSLAIYDMSVKPLAVSGGNGLYQVKLTLGTNDVSAVDRDVSQKVTCKPPTDNSSDFNYCSVADFDFIVRTGGSGR